MPDLNLRAPLTAAEIARLPTSDLLSATVACIGISTGFLRVENEHRTTVAINYLAISAELDARIPPTARNTEARLARLEPLGSLVPPG